MEKLLEVETARALMTEAMTWSVMRWLREKKRVRRTADQANAALNQLSEAMRKAWPDRIKTPYEALAAQAARPAAAHRQQRPPLPVSNQEAMLIAKKLKESDDEAYRARMDTEETFDKAEKQLSTSLAREGCRKAIHCWDLHEKAIRKAEAVISQK
ncbi:MAG TPA: hypothetical protein VGK96_18935 [Candidatus Sulfotelmatobacter sp.]|jgi:hypothetical protein